MAVRRITNANYLDSDWQNEIETKNILKVGYFNIYLTEMDTTAVPVVKAGSSIEVNGVLVKFDTDTSPASVPATDGDCYLYISDIGAGIAPVLSISLIGPAVSNTNSSKGGIYLDASYISRCIARMTKVGSTYTNKTLLATGDSLMDFGFGPTARNQIGVGATAKLGGSGVAIGRLANAKATSSGGAVAVGIETIADDGAGAIGYKAIAYIGGGAVGKDAHTTDGGGAVGNNTHTTTGGSVGSNAYTTEGGAVGYNSSTTTGGAIGKNSSSANGGGAVGYTAYSTTGGAVGYTASATTGGAVGYNASATTGGAIGYNASTTTGGFAGGNGAISSAGGAIGSNAHEAAGGGAVGYNAHSWIGGAVGSSANETGGGFAGGYGATDTGGGAAIGYISSATAGGGAVGYNASATNGFSGGYGAVSGYNQMNMFNCVKFSTFPAGTTYATIYDWLDSLVPATINFPITVIGSVGATTPTYLTRTATTTITLVYSGSQISFVQGSTATIPWNISLLAIKALG